MSPRRPVPARPGTRPPRRPVRQASAPGRGEDTSGGAAPSPAPAASSQAPGAPRTGAGTRRAYTVVRVGGPDGASMSVPARTLVLALVALGAFIIVFPALRGFLSQQAQYDALRADLAQAQATSTALEEQLARWQDDDYVRTQARQRLFYVMPGETTYVVVGADHFEEEIDQAEAASSDELPWYETLRRSAEIAGDTGAQEPEANQRGWSTAVPTLPTAPAATTQPTASAGPTP